MRSLVAVEMETDHHHHPLETKPVNSNTQMLLNCKEIAALKSELFNLKSAYFALEARVNYQSPFLQVEKWKESVTIPSERKESQYTLSELSQEEVRINAAARMKASPGSLTFPTSMIIEQEVHPSNYFPTKSPQTFPFLEGVN